MGASQNIGEYDRVDREQKRSPKIQGKTKEARQVRGAASKRQAFEVESLGMYDEMVKWRKEHPQATFDEIAGQMSVRRRRLMGQFMGELAVQEIEKETWQEQVCPDCGGKMENKGERERRVVHSEGETDLDRPYYHCTRCGSGFFPLG